MDGTFKTSPELFFEVYTIHSCTANWVLPCVYALLPNKQQATCHRLFEILKEHQNALGPQNVIVDFKPAVLNAIDASFPDSSKKGCFFHFKRNQKHSPRLPQPWHHAVSSGLSPQLLLMFRLYANPNGFFTNHQPTGNHCTISKLCTWETMKIFKKRNTKILLWGVFVLGGLCPGAFVRGFLS